MRNTVVPAQAGTYNHRPLDMGPRLRGDDLERRGIGVAELPKLSVRLSGAIDPRQCLGLARIAEANRYHSIWFAENAFARGVLPAAAACAAAKSDSDSAFVRSNAALAAGTRSPSDQNDASISPSAALARA